MRRLRVALAIALLSCVAVAAPPRYTIIDNRSVAVVVRICVKGGSITPRDANEAWRRVYSNSWGVCAK